MNSLANRSHAFFKSIAVRVNLGAFIGDKDIKKLRASLTKLDLEVCRKNESFPLLRC